MAKTPWKAALTIVLLCFGVRLLSAVAIGSYARLNHTELDKIAISLASGEGYSNAFGQRDEPSTGPTAHYPPVYPFVLSLVYGLCGAGVGGEIGKYVLTVSFVGLTLGALPFVARAFGLPGSAALYAGLFGAAVPLYLYTELRGGELPFLGLLLVMATVAFRATMRQPSFGSGEAVRHGLLWGLILCTSPSPAPVLALWVALLFLWHRPPVLTALRFAAVLLVTILGLMSPWAARNYFVLGRPILARSNLGLELQVSNNDLATPTGYDNQSGAVFDLYHPNRSLLQRLRYRAIGEVAYHREKMREAVDWIGSHPARFGRLTLLRVWYFWTAPARRPAQLPALYAISGLAIFGLWRLIRTQRTDGLQFLALWLGFSFIYCFVQFENRYRYPIFWSLLLLAGFGLTELTRIAERQYDLRMGRPAV